MPAIKFTSVVSFSSEDKKFPAENLLKPEGTAKWKSAVAGEKSVSAIIQLEKPTQIHQIDIGNEGSAFIEVLVGKAAQKEAEYQVIIVTSSFMNPQESRSGTNLTRVRIFHADQLSQAVKSDKWDRIKVICTQPFNKTSAYGLSFIKLHSPPSKDDAASAETPKTQTKIGAFALKSEDDDGIQTGSLFAKKKTEPSPLTGAAAMRQASRQADVRTTGESSTPSRPKPSSTITPKVTPGSSKKRPKDEDEDADDDFGGRAPTPKIKRSATESSTSSSTSERPVIKKSKTESSVPSSSCDFSTLMKKVVFVMSGYQNPERAEIRDEAIEMGATYRPDWGKGCTHLICAFTNTPKYQQVRGKGRIVSAEWIRRCYKKKECLPWRKFRVGKAETPAGSSGSDTEDEMMTSQPSRTPSQSKTPVQKEKKEKKEEKEKVKEPEREPAPKKKATSHKGKGVQFDSDSGEDTDDEINRVREQNKTKPSAAAAEADPYEISTDDEGDAVSNGKSVANGNQGEDDETDDDGELPPLPDYFKSKHFYIHGKFAHSDRRGLVRYITAYNGVLEDYMSDSIKYVITDSKWDDTFDDAVSENPDIVFVKPEWVRAVHEKKKFVPYQKYVIVPE